MKVEINQYKEQTINTAKISNSGNNTVTVNIDGKATAFDDNAIQLLFKDNKLLLEEMKNLKIKLDEQRNEYDLLSENDLLARADSFYNIGDYYEVINIYKDDRLSINPIALNNLGFIYENGLGVDASISIAKKYFNQAAKLNNQNAIDNYMIFNIKYPYTYDDLLENLKFGYINKSEVVYKFINENFNSYDDNYILLPPSQNADIFFTKEPGEQEKILESMTYTTPVFDYFGFSDSDFITLDNNWAKQTVAIGSTNTMLEDGIINKKPILAQQNVFHFKYTQKFLFYTEELNTQFIHY